MNLPLPHDQMHRTDDRLDALLLEGLESGGPVPVTPEYWNKLRQEAANRRAKQKAVDIP